MGKNWIYLFAIPVVLAFGLSIIITIKKINKEEIKPKVIDKNISIVVTVGWLILFITSLVLIIISTKRIYAELSPKYLSRIYEVFDLNKIEYLREYFTENILLLELNVLTTHSNIYTLIAAMIISFKCVIIEFYKALKKGYYK